MAKASLDSSMFYQMSSSSIAINEPVRVEDRLLLSEQVRDYITSDPEGLCQRHVREQPSATFQAISLAYLEGKSWKEISESFNLGVSAVKNFFQRRLKEIAPAIKSYIQSELN
jgi:DNA-directed RNA polymerase specialized sigma24 family protein